MPIPRHTAGALLAVAAAGLLQPAAASAAPALAPLKPCYLSVAPGRTEPVAVTGSGFSANARVDLRVDGVVVAANLAVDAAGRLSAQVRAPYQPRAERRFKLEAVERANPARSAIARARVSALRVKLRPQTSSPDDRVRWFGRGFTASGPVYAHYLKAGSERTTIRLARPEGPCGTFEVRRRQFPFRPSVGTWTVQIDQQEEYAEMPVTPFVRLPIMVRRVAAYGE